MTGSVAEHFSESPIPRMSESEDMDNFYAPSSTEVQQGHRVAFKAILDKQ